MWLFSKFEMIILSNSINGSSLENKLFNRYGRSLEHEAPVSTFMPEMDAVFVAGFILITSLLPSPYV
jgi:hypothetical protein